MKFKINKINRYKKEKNHPDWKNLQKNNWLMM